MSDVHSARYESVHLSIDAGHALGLTYTDPEAAGTDVTLIGCWLLVVLAQ
jgi:hypothetical protein